MKKTMKSQRKRDDLVRSVGEMIKASRKLARQAEQQYSVAVEDIFQTKSRDCRCIEHLLDGMLDFCFDPGMLVLYKKLCRYYWDIDSTATASYVYAYRDMWDENEKPRDAT